MIMYSILIIGLVNINKPSKYFLCNKTFITQDVLERPDSLYLKCYFLPFTTLAELALPLFAPFDL